MELPAFLRRKPKETPEIKAPTYKHTPTPGKELGMTHDQILTSRRRVIGIPPPPPPVEDADPLDNLATGILVAEVLADVFDLGSETNDTGPDFAGDGGSFGGGGSSGDF